MRLMAAFAVIATVGTVPAKPKPLVIPLKPRPETWVCAEYESAGAPRHVERSCVEARQVAGWILREGRPADECGP